ncbi:hypothetical protein L2E82_21015 [Cichorium intybus]|uniref:Uncharacterized protein n=1 Tax=Cichorium intybus TaxID=13427 RepID=A0ACB9DV90_CICIN|nr:hypothetical protein L2E82_21015 [Cichorium intybus]
MTLVEWFDKLRFLRFFRFFWLFGFVLGDLNALDCLPIFATKLVSDLFRIAANDSNTTCTLPLISCNQTSLDEDPYWSSILHIFSDEKAAILGIGHLDYWVLVLVTGTNVFQKSKPLSFSFGFYRVC